MKRGDVYWLELPDQQGREQHGTRPAAIVMSDLLLSSSPVIAIVPFTTQLRHRSNPACLFIPKGEGGLTEDSVALVFQVRAVDKARLKQKIGSLSSKYIKALDDVLQDVLGLI